jgi:glycosyltransferase involved in cell wall biosynthesis
MNANPRKNRISVALCTYNGETFLPAQLASMQQQTRLPDELIICDDCSTDNTIAVVRDFAAFAPFPVTIVENTHTLGSTKNFEKAMQLCSGDLIALSDQDDLWRPDRLAHSERELNDHPEAGLVFSDGEIMNEQGQPTGERMWPSAQFSPQFALELLAGDYDLLFKYRFVTGATVMFRAPLRSACLPLPAQWVHDEWLAAIVPALAEIRPIAEPLIFYRRHASQQIGLSTVQVTKSSVKNHWNAVAAGESTNTYWNKLTHNINFARIVCDRLSALPLDERGHRVLARYQAWLRFASFRRNLPRNRILRIFPILKRYPWYRQQTFGLTSAVKDLIRSLPE